MLLHKAIEKNYINLELLKKDSLSILSSGTVIEKTYSFVLMDKSIKEFNLYDAMFNLTSEIENKVNLIEKELLDKYQNDFLGINSIILDPKISIIDYSYVEREHLTQLSYLFSEWTLSKDKSKINYDNKSNIISLSFLNSFLQFDFSQYKEKSNIGNFIKKANKLFSNRDVLNYLDSLLVK